MVFFSVLFAACSLSRVALVRGWLVLLAGALLASLISRFWKLGERAVDEGFGVLYLGIASVALVWLRSGEAGRDWALMLLAIAWAADIFAFVAGNILKGPKLWPRFSPASPPNTLSPP